MTGLTLAEGETLFRSSAPPHPIVAGFIWGQNGREEHAEPVTTEGTEFHFFTVYWVFLVPGISLPGSKSPLSSVFPLWPKILGRLCKSGQRQCWTICWSSSWSSWGYYALFFLIVPQFPSKPLFFKLTFLVAVARHRQIGFHHLHLGSARPPVPRQSVAFSPISKSNWYHSVQLLAVGKSVFGQSEIIRTATSPKVSSRDLWEVH